MAKKKATRARSKANASEKRSSVEDDLRIAQDATALFKPQLDIEHQLNGWENDFRAIKESASAESDQQFLDLAKAAISGIDGARQGIKFGSVQQAVLGMSNMADAYGKMLSLDTQAAVEWRVKALGNLDIGRRLTNEDTATEAVRIRKLIRKEVATTLRSSPVKMSSTSAREALARKTHFDDGTPMVSLRVIHDAFCSDDKR